MVTYLSDQKKKKECYSRVNSKKARFENFIGTLTSTFTASEHGPLYYRTILTNKGDSLNVSKSNYNTRMKLTINALQELKWWENNIFYIFIYTQKKWEDKQGRLSK